MADQITGAGVDAPAAGKKNQKTYLGLTRNQAFAAAGVFVAVLVYIVWKKRKSAAATSGTGTAQSAQDCVDSNGNPTPCSSTDFAGQLSAIETELQTLAAAQQSGGGGSSGGGGGWYGGSGDTGSSTAGTTVPTTDTGTANPGSTSTSTTGTSTSTGSSTSTTAGRLSAPSGVHQTIFGKTGVQVQWTAVSGAVGYVCQCKRGGDNGTTTNGPFNVTSTTANFGGLQAGTGYTALIWPSSSSIKGGPGSNQPHAEFAFKTNS